MNFKLRGAGFSINEADIVVENIPIDQNVNGTGSPSADSTSPSNTLRSTLAQCFATYVNSLSYMSLGLMYSMPSVVIANVKNSNGSLSLNDEQVSWYASLLPIFQPLGCLIGGFLQNYIGRKQGLLLMNVSTVTSWILLYKATNVEMLYLSSSLMGVSVGFAEAPSVTYVCEITTPKLRGTLVTYNNSNVIFGMMLTYLLAAFMSWRTSSLVCMALSILSVQLLFFIPDSPVWLINKGRVEEAMKALQWLRGWVSEAQVLPEFTELTLFVKRSYSRDSSNEDNERTRRKRKFEINYLLEKATLRPFIFLCIYISFAYAASLQAAKNYYLVIFDSLKLNMDSNWLAFLNGLSSLTGSLVCAATVKILGKRSISLISMISSSVLSILLGLYITLGMHIPPIFIVLYILSGFTQAAGICTLPWVLLGEVYPVKTRSVATGITGAAFYASLSVFVKTYYYLLLLITSQGALFILYGAVGIIGFFYLWISMPETEGKTMAEIEELFEDDARNSCPHFRRKI